MPEVKALQRSPEWFAARKSRITGSVAGAILGLNPWSTPQDAMRQMVREYHGAEREFTGNAATEWGTFNENGATFDFTLETGMDVKECGFFEFEEWLGASPDGLLGEHGVIEIKCPFGIRNDKKPTFKHIKNDAPYYYAQIQLEMLCTGREYVKFFQWTPHATDLQTYERDEAWLKKYLPKLRKFYEKFLVERDNPIYLEDKRPVITKKAAVLLCEEIDDLGEAIERATERKKEALKELVEMTGTKNVEINGRLLTLVDKVGSISYAKMVKRLKPNITEKYKDKFRGKPSQYWKLT